MANRIPPPPREFNWARMLRTLSFWALLIVGTIALVQLASSRRREEAEITYTQFTEELNAGNIVSVEIAERQKIRGAFQRPVVVKRQTVERFNVLLPFEAGDQFVAGLSAKGVDVRARESGQSFGSVLILFLPYLLIFGLVIFMLRQMQQGGNRAFAFGKSKAKLLAGDTPKVTFADVAGCDEAKQELEEIIDFLKDPQKFQRLGGRLPKGALLVGPPGTGKTLLAKAVAGEAGRPFFSMSGSDFVEMFVGVGASRVRDLFEQGKAHAPCIIFIDEIDAVGRHRGAGLGGGHDEREQTLNQLLVEMDGFESNDGVILLAATNRPDILDPALLRPGRFDRQIVVDMPDLKGREQILRVHVRKIPMAGGVNLERIARGTPGLAGAELANIVNEAALLAARRNKSAVDMQDFEDAKDKVMLGLERKSRVLSDEERRLVAYHEAGHALVGLTVPDADPLHKVTIIPRGRALGLTAYLPEEELHKYTKRSIESRLAMAYGGRVAEELDDRRRAGHSAGDQHRAPHGHAVRHERGDRSDCGGGSRAGDLPRPRSGAAPGDFRSHGTNRGRRSEEHPHARLRRGGAYRQRAACRARSPGRGVAGARDAGARAGRDGDRRSDVAALRAASGTGVAPGWRGREGTGEGRAYVGRNPAQSAA